MLLCSKNVSLDEGKQNTCSHNYFILPTFPIFVINSWSAAKPAAWFLILLELLYIIPVDFCCVTSVCISHEPRVIYLVIEQLNPLIRPRKIQYIIVIHEYRSI